MKNFLKSHVVFSPDPGGGGGGAPAAAAAPAGGGAPASAAATNTDPNSGAGGGSPPAAGGGSPPAAAADYWPENLDQTFKGADQKSTLDNLAKALNGYRERDSKNLVPKTPEDYLNFETAKDFKIDPKNQPHFETLKTDPTFKAIATEAHKMGIGQTAMMGMYQAGLNAMAEAGLLQPPLNAKSERAALVPDAAKSLPEDQQNVAVEKRLNDNYAFLDTLVQNKGMPKDIAEHLELSLGDSAKGHQALEWFKAQLGGTGTGPGAHGQGGAGDTKESLRAEMDKLDRNAPDYAKKSAELDERYKKLYGN